MGPPSVARVPHADAVHVTRPLRQVEIVLPLRRSVTRETTENVPVRAGGADLPGEALIVALDRRAVAVRKALDVG